MVTEIGMGVETSDNWPLEEVKQVLSSGNLADPGLANKLAIQKVEYGRTCMTQLLTRTGGMTPQKRREYHDDLDQRLANLIVEMGGNAKG